LVASQVAAGSTKPKDRRARQEVIKRLLFNRVDAKYTMAELTAGLRDLPPAESMAVKSTPGSLQQALDALEADHAFLLRGDVFTKDFIETWLSYKRKKEVDAIALRPHPYEFHLYFDI
jgi:glutamine synthetase